MNLSSLVLLVRRESTSLLLFCTVHSVFTPFIHDHQLGMECTINSFITLSTRIGNHRHTRVDVGCFERSTGSG